MILAAEGIVSGIIQWSNEIFLPFGPLGLFLVAFMESSFFPIPPDLLLIPLALANPELALLFGLITTLGSVCGALLGYYIGLKGGRPLLIKLAGEKKTQSVENYFDKYGNWAIGIAGFTPVPYKVFTITAGVLKFSVKNLLVVSAITRGARFMLEAALLMLWGRQIVAFLNDYLGIVSIIGVIGFILAYFFFGKILNYMSSKDKAKYFFLKMKKIGLKKN